MIEAVHLYVDGDNLLYLQKERGWWIDQKKFLDFFKKRYPALSEAYYYSSLPTEGKEGVPRKKFFTLLSMLGYRVVTRVPKPERKNGMVAIRGCSDMLMCRDIILDLDRYGTCILVTGDGDFSCVIETLRARGKNFLVVSSPPVIGEELRKVAGMNYLSLIHI